MFWLGFLVFEVVGLVVGDIVTNDHLDLPVAHARLSYQGVPHRQMYKEKWKII